jgi:acetolactate decarboxylase
VAGYHLHFLSSDHQHGGHVLELEAEEFQLRLETLNDFHLVLPGLQSFLRAHLTKNTGNELACAKQAH